MDKHLQDRMEILLARLSIPVSLMEREMASQLSAEVRNALKDMADGMPQAVGGMLYLPVKQPAVLLTCPDNLPGARDVLVLAGELVSSLGSSEHHGESSADVYRRALLGEVSGTELEALASEFQLPREFHCCVMVFHMVQTGKHRAFDLLREITPTQSGDVLVDMDRHTVALVKDLTDGETVEELSQFAQALQETLMSETAHQMTVGIGHSRHTLDELRESYAEARRSIEVGRIFQPEGSVFVYSRLILERFLMELPQDISAYYHSLLFNRKTMRLFNEEMLYTIDMFFKKDLNLSDTARQLYIHRNTLVYRLDKVQRQTGLDLRSFDDAVTFKILMELKKCGGNKAERK